MSRSANAFIVLCCLVGLICYFSTRDTYRPVYYPDGADLSVYTRGPRFDNIAQARQWIEDQHSRRSDKQWDYEIGKNCKPFENSDIEVCKETLR